MLPNEVLCEMVESTLYPIARTFQALVEKLYTKQFSIPRGPQGLSGSNELDYTIQFLDGSINLLLAIAEEQGISVSRFSTLYPKVDYVSKDGNRWEQAKSSDLDNPEYFKLLKTGALILPKRFIEVPPEKKPTGCVFKRFLTWKSKGTENG